VADADRPELNVTGTCPRGGDQPSDARIGRIGASCCETHVTRLVSLRRDDLFAVCTGHNRPPPAWKENLGTTVSNRVCSLGANC